MKKPAPLPIIGPPPNPLEDPILLARKIVAHEAFTDADAIRVADAYLFLVDDGAAA